MTMRARIEVQEALANRRRANRRLLRLQVPGVVTDRPGVDVLIHDLSLSGLLIETSAELAVGAQFEVELPEAGGTEATVVWASGRYFGCQFGAAIAQRALSAALLMNPVVHVPRSALEPGDPAIKWSGATPLAEGTTSEMPLASRVRLVGALALGAWALVLMPIAFAAHIIP